MEGILKDLKQRLDKTGQKADQAKKEATAEQNTAIKWNLGGYGKADYLFSDASSTSHTFGNVGFHPVFLVGYKDLLLFESELETTINSDAYTNIGVEFADLNLYATDWLTFTAGGFMSPIGDFQQHLHPAWISKLPSRPAGFAEDAGAEPLTAVGVMAPGAVPIGSMTGEYAVFVGNGPRLSDDAAEGVLLEGFGADNNHNKAFGGRIGLRPLPYVSV